MVKLNNRITRKKWQKRYQSVSVLFKEVLTQWMNYITLKAEIMDIGRSEMTNTNLMQSD